MPSHGFYTNESRIRFIDKIISNLKACTAFDFSVSFIKKAGLVLLMKPIEEALKRGVKGRLLTSTYQNFTDIPSLEVFLRWQNEFPNFECHLEHESYGDDGFHTKGYIFRFGDHAEVVIGSSNITRFALLKNKEWDMSALTNEGDSFFREVVDEFEYLWTTTDPLSADLIKNYSFQIDYAIEKWDMDYIPPEGNRPIRPNVMQQKALKEIRRYRSMGADKALVVAATGSGKTYLAAFDALNFDAKKLLFVVHKDMILVEAMKTFQKVFGSSRTYGLYNGHFDETGADFIFASNQMISRHLDLFDSEEFDYIVVDEVHHASASTYMKILSHFKPSFLLGLTATPDRMDGQSIYDLFGKNVPYDLRLREALENDLVVPFRYYGIKDSFIDYGDDLSQSGIRKYIQQFASDINCAFIKEKIEQYRPKGKLKAVAFCRNIEQARLMAVAMAGQGYETTFLTGSNDTGQRIKAFSDLQDDKNPLEIVFAVDILNEGIDVPGMNMVLFLRPTDSQTIFIQQLGRGLRKYDGKKYLTVLDFIGNSYKRSVQIALALGTLTKGGTTDKRTIGDLITDQGAQLDLPGVEIHFDRESMDEILASIEHTNFNTLKILQQDYLNYKAYLKLKPGEYPKHTDFLNAEVSADLLRYTKKFNSYYDFLLRVEESAPSFSEEEADIIRTLSWHLPLLRKEEYLIIRALMDKPLRKDDIMQMAKEHTNCSEKRLEHALKVLQNQMVFTRPSYYKALIKDNGGLYSLAFSCENGAFKDWISDLLEYGLERFESEYGEDENDLHLYGIYTGPKSFMALCHDNMFYMSGVHYLGDQLCLYINLNKDGQVNENLKYVDRFLNPRILQWESQTGTTLLNGKGKRLIEQRDALIFVRKNKTEDGVEMPFAYLGKGTLTRARESDNKGKTLLFDIVLEKEVPEGYWYEFGIDNRKNEA